MKNAENNAVEQIEDKLESLIKLCHQLRQENKMLRHAEQSWKIERVSLIEKNEMAQAKIELMISRLKALE